jgi:opacity protein-like surface antigen
MLMPFRRTAYGLCALLLISCPLAAFGQDYVPKGSVDGGLAYGKFYDDEGSLGSGLSYRASAGWRPWGRFGFEGELLGIRFRRGDAFKVEGNAQLVFGNVIWHFSRSRVQPYIKGGVGALRTDYTYSWPGLPSPTFHKSKSGIAADLGAGVQFFLNRHWSMNPDFRLAAGSEYIMTTYVSISLGYHW